MHDKEICIQVGMGESQTIKTMIHEVAHAMLHNSDFMKQHGEEKRQAHERNRSRKHCIYGLLGSGH